jgi:hypothetical protein
MAKLAEGHGELQAQGRQSKVEDTKALDDYDTTALKGWCGMDELGKSPSVLGIEGYFQDSRWGKVKSVAGNDEYKSIYFTEEQMKDLTTDHEQAKTNHGDGNSGYSGSWGLKFGVPPKATCGN